MKPPYYYLKLSPSQNRQQAMHLNGELSRENILRELAASRKLSTPKEIGWTYNTAVLEVHDG